ncbi:MAG: hypothetical protein NTZ55_03760, partial [Candidatus Roizmanbacteria bacterium]|nr:hypothetical protein [Candidatus Roizmanbacteria bacterium]
MVQKKKDGINLRTILFVFFGFIIVASLAYKYFEWAVAKDVVNTYNRNWTKELKVLENDEVEASESAETITKLYEYIGSDKFTYEDVFDQFDKLNALLNVGINDSENHLEILKQNKNNL